MPAGALIFMHKISSFWYRHISLTSITYYRSSTSFFLENSRLFHNFIGVAFIKALQQFHIIVCIICICVHHHHHISYIHHHHITSHIITYTLISSLPFSLNSMTLKWCSTCIPCYPYYHPVYTPLLYYLIYSL